MNETENLILINYSIVKRDGRVIALIPNRYIKQSKYRKAWERYCGQPVKLHTIIEIGKPKFTRSDFEF